jgi:hypothetical protein
VLIVRSISLLLIGIKGCVGVVRNMELSNNVILCFGNNYLYFVLNGNFCRGCFKTHGTGDSDRRTRTRFVRVKDSSIKVIGQLNPNWMSIVKEKELLITKDSIKYEEDKFGKVFGDTKKGNTKARVKIN